MTLKILQLNNLFIIANNKIPSTRTKKNFLTLKVYYFYKHNTTLFNNILLQLYQTTLFNISIQRTQHQTLHTTTTLNTINTTIKIIRTNINTFKSNITVTKNHQSITFLFNTNTKLVLTDQQLQQHNQKKT